MKRFVLLLAVATLALAGCGSGSERADGPGKELYVFNWTEYMPQEAIDMFEAETGIKVIYSTFESNEAMYAKVKLAGGEGYDIIVPSTYFVSRMAREGLLEPIDKSLLPNFANLNPAVLDKEYDPGNVYSVPYLWGGTGILYDSSRTEPVTSWKDLWREDLKGRVLLQDDLREVLGIGLLLSGRSLNETDEDALRQAYELLKGLAPSVRTYNSDNPKTVFLGGEVDAGMIWNGEAYVAIQENPDLAFVWPEEGGQLWMDNLAIPKGARNVENAHAFIDFLLRPEISAMVCEELGYPTPNLKALDKLPAEVAGDPVIFPPDEVLNRSEFQNDVGEAIVIYEKYWELLRTGE